MWLHSSSELGHEILFLILSRVLLLGFAYQLELPATEIIRASLAYLADHLFRASQGADLGLCVKFVSGPSLVRMRRLVRYGQRAVTRAHPPSPSFVTYLHRSVEFALTPVLKSPFVRSVVIFSYRSLASSPIYVCQIRMEQTTSITSVCPSHNHGVNVLRSPTSFR